MAFCRAELKRSEEDLKRWAVTVKAGYAWAGSTYRRGGYGVTMAAERIRFEGVDQTLSQTMDRMGGALADALQQLAQLGGLLRVEAGGRLVQQQQARLRGQRACQLHPSLQAVGQAAGGLVRALGQTHALQQRQRLLTRLRLLPARRGQGQQRGPEAVAHAAVSAHQHVVQHRQLSEQAQVLEGAAHAQLAHRVRRQRGHVDTGKADLPAAGCDDAAEHVDHGRLARAIGADQRVDVAALQGEGHILRRLHTAIGLAQALHLQQRGIAAGSCCCGGLSGQSGLCGQGRRRARPPAAQRAHHATGHDVQRKQQQRAIDEVLHRRPACQQRVDQRQQHGTHQRPVQRARTPEQHQQQDEDREVEVDEVGVDVLVLLRDERTGDAAGHGGDDEGHRPHVTGAEAE